VRVRWAQPGDWIHHPASYSNEFCHNFLYVSEEIWLEWNAESETFRWIRPVIPFHHPENCPRTTLKFS